VTLSENLLTLLFADFRDVQALNPAAAAMTAAASATSKDSHKRKRRHSSVASADESRPAEPSTSSSKGKAKAVEANGEHGEGRVKGKRVRANKQLVPVDEIMKGGTAPWQQEYVLEDSLSWRLRFNPDALSFSPYRTGQYLGMYQRFLALCRRAS
jgi:hypothetical protein